MGFTYLSIPAQEFTFTVLVQISDALKSHPLCNLLTVLHSATTVKRLKLRCVNQQAEVLHSVTLAVP
jgi:hypothetical protein